jgi:hypothetical protein
MEILPEDQALPVRGRGYNKYPWESWFRHRTTVRIFKGEDFHVSVITMRQQIYQKAKGYGGKVATSLGRDLKGRECIDITYYSAPSDPEDELRSIEILDRGSN